MAETASEPIAGAASPEAFTERAFGDLVGALTVSLAVLGDRLGLFKNLAAGGPATSAELAARAGISERYAREWLSAMACAGYLTYDSASARFSLPAHHAGVLADEPGPYFLGGSYAVVQMMAEMNEAIGRAFVSGAGVAQAEYPASTWDALERETSPLFENLLVQTWLPAAPTLLEKLERGALVADVGCGSGRAVIKMAQEYPLSRFVGYDLFPAQVERARANVAAAGLSDRVQIAERDVTTGLPGEYDIITSFDVVHDSHDPLALLRAIRQALKPDGIYLIQEFASGNTLEENIVNSQLGTFLYGSSVFYCLPVALAGGDVGLGTAGLPESKLRELAAAAGFGTVSRLPVADLFHAVYEIRP